MRSLFGGEASSLSAVAAPAESGRSTAPTGASAKPGTDLSAIIAEAANDLADYQRLTAEGKLGEAGQKLEQLKRKLDQLNARKK
jgi:hypothetical protein